MPTSGAHARHAQTAGQAVEPGSGTSTPPGVDPRNTEHRRYRPASYDRGVQIAAAKVRVATDKKLKQKTPQWIVELSREEKSASAS